MCVFQLAWHQHLHCTPFRADASGSAMPLKALSSRSLATQTVLLFLDHFFDMLDVHSKGEYVHTRKDDMKPLSGYINIYLSHFEGVFGPVLSQPCRSCQREVAS